MGRSYSVDGVCGTKDEIIYDRALDMFDMLFSQTAAGLGQQSVSCVFFLSAPPPFMLGLSGGRRRSRINSHTGSTKSGPGSRSCDDSIWVVDTLLFASIAGERWR